jgi:hypothetical protein
MSAIEFNFFVSLKHYILNQSKENGKKMAKKLAIQK